LCNVHRLHGEQRPPRCPTTFAARRTLVLACGVYAQALADAEGPRVDVRAVLTDVSASRRMRAAFRVEDDAYVLIGHVDPDGNVRIVFPNDPHDDGFVKGQKSYETGEFFAGFSDQYRYRYQNTRYRGFRPDSYDGGFGYVFIVASWRPMHFEKFSGENGWDSFEMSDVAYMADPRPAIYELASLLAGENRESYTVKFARYYNTQNVSPFASSYSGYNAFGYGFCPGAQPFGFASTPFSLTYYNPAITYGYDFTYRGTQYLYSAAGDCYYSAPAYYGNGYTLGGRPVPGTPTTPGTPSRPRVMTAEDSHRKPGEPHPPGGKVLIEPKDAGSDVGAHLAQHSSPQYRDRGLITTEDGSTPPVARRGPRVETNEPTRPSIQQMVERRTTNQNDGSGWTRTRAQPTTGGDDRPARVNGGNVNNSQPRSEPETHSRPTPQDNPRSAPQSAPRYEPPPRVETPRSEPPASRPAPSEVRPSEPPSSSSSSKPIKP
jgi:hypothetical protein